MRTGCSSETVLQRWHRPCCLAQQIQTRTHAPRTNAHIIPWGQCKPLQPSNKLSSADYHKQRLYFSAFVWESSFCKYFREQSLNQDSAQTQVYLKLIATTKPWVYSVGCGLPPSPNVCIPDADSTRGPPKTLSMLYWLKMYKDADKELPSTGHSSAGPDSWGWT